MYKAILFAPDGDSVCDYRGKTIEEVWNRCDNGGSRWIFYPLCFVIKDHGSVKLNQRIVSANDRMSYLTGLSVKSVIEYIEANTDRLVDELNS